MTRAAKNKPKTLGAAMVLTSIGDREHQAVAKLLGISKDYLSGILNGHKQPSLEIACLLEERLGVPPKAWLVKIASDA